MFIKYIKEKKYISSVSNISIHLILTKIAYLGQWCLSPPQSSSLQIMHTHSSIPSTFQNSLQCLFLPSQHQLILIFSLISSITFQQILAFQKDRHPNMPKGWRKQNFGMMQDFAKKTCTRCEESNATVKQYTS